MKKIILILLLFNLKTISYAQKKHSIKIDTLNIHLVSFNLRILELALGAEFKYLYLKKEKGIAPIIGFGYSAILNNSTVKNAYYNADGAFIKLGLLYYYKYNISSIYLGYNTIYSLSNQILKPTFTSPIWGTYQETYNTLDFNIGAECILGFIFKINNKIFIQSEGSFGIKLLDEVNPIREKIISNKPSYIPYFTPGMGRGGLIFINTSIGLGYQF
jgi:hypothetical protein